MNGRSRPPRAVGGKENPGTIEPARLRVQYADTDAMGVVYYGTYLRFFEAGRIEAMRQAGALYGDLVRTGVHSPVVEALVRYHAPARFDDLLRVAAHVTELRGARFAFSYAVTREGDDALVASGRTLHACVDAATLRPVRIPAWVAAVLERLRDPAPAGRHSS